MDQDRFQFFSGSKDAKPGKGTGERTKDPARYAELCNVKNWRQILSNFSTTEIIKYDRYSFRSIEHAFQYKKISIADTSAALQFAIESRSDLSKGDGKQAQKARKMIKLNPAQLLQWEDIKADVMTELADIKISVCPLYARILKDTKDAELWHSSPRIKAERWMWLENLRRFRFDSEC